MICIGIMVAYCFAAEPTPTDSFCQVYRPIVIARGDGTISATSGAKRRLLANELTYRKLCQGK